jgi:hypothetical protein
METVAKRFSPALFAFVLFCFFLPFVSVSCQQQKVATFTGIQLVTGTNVQEPQLVGPPKSDRLNPEPLAILAFFCGVIGLGLSFLKGRNRGIASATFAAGGAIALLFLKSRVDGQFLNRSSGFIHPDYEIGFWLALISYFAAAALNASVFLAREKPPASPPPEGTSP